MRLTSCGATHQGRHRPSNQDSYYANDDLNLYIVADGVESGPHGEVASKMAVDCLYEIISQINLDSDATPPFEHAKGIPVAARALKFAIREVNRRLYEKAHDDPALLGMGTTLSAIWIVDNKAYIAHVGDSRAYLIRKGQAQQLTRDHTSLATGDAEQVQTSEFLEQFSMGSEHELTRAMAINPDVEVQLAGGTPKPSDIFMLCTDGLYGELREFELQDAVAGQEPAMACSRLVQMANQRGGKDNMAVVVIKIG